MSPEIRFVREFTRTAKQLNTVTIGRQWYATSIGLNMSIGFANKGYTPSEGMALLQLVVEGNADTYALQDMKEIMESRFTQ